MNPDKVMVWIQVGGVLTQVAMGTFASIRAALSGAPGVEADNVALDATHADYQRRIAQAKLEAGATPQG